jgi:pimeloyl-ACP methyl ester carboxylesterase
MNDRIVFNTIGSGKPLLLIHPLGLDHHIWDFCLEDFSEIRTVITYDLPGHGTNSVPNESYGIEDLSSNLYQALQESQIEKIDCLGLSIGGMILQVLASSHSHLVEKLILVDTTYKYSKEWQDNWATRATAAREHGLENMIEQFLAAFFTKKYLDANKEPIQYCRDTLSKMNGEAYAKACEALSDCNTEDRINLIEAETLILCGNQDNELFKDAARWLDDRISESKMHWLRNAQHLAPLEQKESFIRKVCNFLEE